MKSIQAIPTALPASNRAASDAPTDSTKPGNQSSMASNRRISSEVVGTPANALPYCTIQPRRLSPQYHLVGRPGSTAQTSQRNAGSPATNQRDGDDLPAVDGQIPSGMTVCTCPPCGGICVDIGRLTFTTFFTVEILGADFPCRCERANGLSKIVKRSIPVVVGVNGGSSSSEPPLWLLSGCEDVRELWLL
jgi:hypothetical protein